MKKVYRFIVLGSMLLFTFVVLGQEYFEPIKMNEGISNISSVGLETSDRGYLIGFYEYTKKDGNYGSISKYDINGKLLWYKRFPEFNVNSLVELIDGSIIACGLKASEDISDVFLSMYIVKLNSCGELEWAKTDNVEYIHGYPIDCFAVRTLIDAGDGVILPIGCDYVDKDSGSVSTWIDLLKLDYDGKIVFRKKIYEGGFVICKEIWNGKFDDNGDLWLSGTTSVKNPFWSNHYFSPLIIKCDLEGNLLYLRTADDEGLDIFGESFDNVPPLMDDDGNLFFGIMNSFIPVGIRDIELCSGFIKVDKDEKLTTYKFSNPDVPYEDYRRSLNGWTFINEKQNIVTAMNYWDDDEMLKGRRGDEILVVKSFSEDNIPHYDYVTAELNSDDDKGENEDDYRYFMNRLYVLDKEANVIDSLELNDYYNLGERTEYIFTTHNNEIVLSTNTRLQNPTNDTYLRKFTSELKPALIDHSEREYDVNCDKAIVSETFSIRYDPLHPPTGVESIYDEVSVLRIYPNPAQVVAKIYLSDGFGEKIIDVYDGMGRVVKSVIIGKYWAYEEIDISDLKSGIYIVKLTVNGKQIATEKLVVK